MESDHFEWYYAFMDENSNIVKGFGNFFAFGSTIGYGLTYITSERKVDDDLR